MSKRSSKVRQTDLPVVDNEVRIRELVRVENKWRKAKRERRNPEVDHMRDPQRDRHIQQHHQCPHAQIDTRARETGKQQTEVRARRCKATTSSNVSSTTVVQVAEDGVAVDLRREDLKDGGKRGDVLC